MEAGLRIDWEVIEGITKNGQLAILMVETCELGTRKTFITMSACIKAAGKAYLLKKDPSL